MYKQLIAMMLLVSVAFPLLTQNQMCYNSSTILNNYTSDNGSTVLSTYTNCRYGCDSITATCRSPEDMNYGFLILAALGITIASLLIFLFLLARNKPYLSMMFFFIIMFLCGYGLMFSGILGSGYSIYGSASDSILGVGYTFFIMIGFILMYYLIDFIRKAMRHPKHGEENSEHEV